MDSNMSKNIMVVRVQALILVSLMIVSGSIVMAPGILASEGGQNQINVSDNFDVIGASWVDVTQSTPATCTPNSNVISLRIEVFSNVADTVSNMAVTYSGTDVGDVSSAILYLDDGDGVYTEGSEVSHGAGTLVGNVYSWSPGTALAAGSNTYYWVRFQLSNAVVTNTVDAYMDAGQITLTNAGTIASALDPAGVCTVGSDLYAPHAIYGYVKDAAYTPLVGVTVTVTHGATAETLVSVSDALGRYDVDLAGYPSGYANGDLIEVTIPNPGYNSTNIVVPGIGEQVDIIVDATAPTSSLSIVPAYNNTGSWNVDFVYDDALVNNYASGVYAVDIYVETPTSGGYVYWLGQMDGFFTGTEAYTPTDGEGVYNFYCIATDYAGNVEAVPGVLPEDSVNYDTTDPTAAATGPAISTSQTFSITYNSNDGGATPSGVDYVSIYWSDDGGNTWNYLGDDSPADGSYAIDVGTLSGDGTYSWYTAAMDNALNSEAFPPALPADVEFETLVDSTAPVIDVASAAPMYFNTEGTFDGNTPPVTIWTNVTDDNILSAAIGIRNEDAGAPNQTFYVSYNFTAAPISWGWDGMMYFVNSELVTATFDDLYLPDVLVWGELNGANATTDVLGTIMPSHYALFGAGVSIYNTHGTLSTGDDTLEFPLGPADEFKVYRYEGGQGHIVGGAYLDPLNTMTLNTLSAPDGNYTVVVSAIDALGNTNFRNEVGGNPVITVDNYAPDADATGPATSSVAAFDVAYTFTDTVAPNAATPSAIVNVTLWHSYEGGAWTLYGDDPTPGDGLFPVDTATLSGDGNYDWFIISYDEADNHESFVHAIEASTIVDTINPTVITTTPLDGAVNVALAAGTYVIEFSEPMDTGIGAAATSDLPGVVWTWSADGYWLNGTYNALTESTTYNVDLNGGGFQDVMGNALIAGGYGWTFDFTTIGVNPEVVTTTPLDGAVNVALAAGTYVIEFSEVMDTAFGTVTSDLPGVVWTWDGTGMWLNGTYNALTENTTYNVDLNGGGFQDPSANPLLIGAYGWTFDFTTIGISPEVVTTTPLDGAVGVALAAGTYVIEFNEPMDTGLGTVTSDLPGVVWAWDGTGMWLNGTYNALTDSTTYTVDLSTGGFKDVAGNILVAGGYGWTFTFDTVNIPPEITLTVPADGDAGVLVNANIVISFSEEMNPASFTYLMSPNPGGWVVTWNGPANDQVTLSHADYNEFMVYTFTVTAAEDINGNALVAGAVANPFTFETIGTFDLNLVAGWNLIGIPVLNPTIGGAPLATADDIANQGALMVTKWDFAGQKYVNYIAGFHVPADPQNFALLPDEAYWVWMPGASTISIVGEYPGARTSNVNGPGWNMVAYMDPVNTGDVETDWAGSVSCGAYDDIASYNAGAFTHYIFAGTTMNLLPGSGYFVWSDGATTIAYGASPPSSVVNQVSGISYGTIQAAINGANPGDNLIVKSGVYTENLLIDQEVEITALGDVTIVGSHTITASNVVIDPITFETSGTAVTIDASAGAIDNVQFLDCIFELPSPGGGIYIGSPVSSNLISNIDVDGCTFNGPMDMISNPIKIGGNFGNPMSQAVDGVTFQNNEVNYGSIPVNLHDENIDNLVFDNNIFRNTDGGVYVWGFGAPTGIMDGFTFTNNDMDATNSYGIGFAIMDVLTDANFVLGNIQVHNNSFDMVPGAYGIGAVSYLSSTAAGDIDARWNWWGDASGPYHPVYNSIGLGSPVSDHVLFDPFYTDAGMTTTGTLPIQNNGVTYATIQDAIGDASPGDIVTVPAGTYYENIDIDESITIQGQAGTIIDGSGTGVVVTISANGVTLSGVTVQNSGANPATDAGIALMGVTGCTVDGNVVDGTANGIGAIASPGNTISNNDVTDVGYYGIVLDENSGFASPGCTVSGNTVTGSGIAALYIGLGCDGTIISGNTFSDSLGGDGIYLWKSAGNTVDNNVITNNVAGYGIHMFGSANNVITHNTITGNMDGFRIRESGVLPSNPNYIHNNTITGNANFGGWSELDGADARWNWWGDATGPYHATNPLGLGNEVSDHILFDPWWSDAGMTTTGTVELTSLTYSVDETTLVGDLDTLTATFPATVPAFFDTAGYVINSEIVLAGDVDGDITITRSGTPDMVIVGGLTAGTYTYTELAALAWSIPEPAPSPFNNALYGGAVEIYTISVENNPAAIDTTVTIRSIISDDGFATRTVLAEIIDTPLVVMSLESVSLTVVVDETTLVGDLDTMTATFPATVPAFFDTAGYYINSEIVLADDVDGDITITRDGVPMTIVGGLTAGTYTYTELVALAYSIPEPAPSIFNDTIYGGATETYAISVENNLVAIDTTVTIRSIISDDGFATRTVLAEIIDAPLVVAAPIPLGVHNTNTGEDFTTIQEAIDDADTLNGHTITVDAGTYNVATTILVDKELTISGAGVGNTIVNIDGVIDIQASSVTITGFEMYQMGWTGATMHPNRCFIEIGLDGVTHDTITISNNYIMGSTGVIYMDGAIDVSIINNEFNIGPADGIYITGYEFGSSSSGSIWIQDNLFDGFYGTGIRLQSASIGTSNIVHNTFNNYMDYAIVVWYATVTIYQNNFLGMPMSGYHTYSYFSGLLVLWDNFGVGNFWNGAPTMPEYSDGAQAGEIDHFPAGVPFP